MPTILVKCANRHNTTLAFHYRNTHIAQVILLIMYHLLVWAILVSSLPIIASILLIVLSFSYFKSLSLDPSFHFNDWIGFLSLKRIDKQISEMGVQLHTQDNKVIRLFRSQFSPEEYKRLLSILDEGASNLSIRVLNVEKK